MAANYAGDSNYAAAMSSPPAFTIAAAENIVTLASPPGSIVYDGTSDVASSVQATLTGVAGEARAEQQRQHSHTIPAAQCPAVHWARARSMLAHRRGRELRRDADYPAASSTTLAFTIAKAGTSVTLSSPPAALFMTARPT